MPTSPRWTVLRNARLLDGTGAPPRAGVDVVLEGGTIATVATGATVVDRIPPARPRSSISKAGRSCPGSSTATST